MINGWFSNYVFALIGNLDLVPTILMTGLMDHKSSLEDLQGQGLAPWLGALDALLEDLGSIPSTHIVTHSLL